MLGQRIAALRHQMNISQAELAKKMGVSPSAIGMYEQGRREPSLAGVVMLSEIFGVTSDYLLTGKLVTKHDGAVLRETLFSAAQRAQVRQLCREGGLSGTELGVLFAAMLTEP